MHEPTTTLSVLIAVITAVPPATPVTVHDKFPAVAILTTDASDVIQLNDTSFSDGLTVAFIVRLSPIDIFFDDGDRVMLVTAAITFILQVAF